MHGVKGVSVCDVIDDYEAVSPLVVALGDGLEPLLARSVPNLQLADLVVCFYHAGLEVPAYRRLVHWFEPFIREPEHEARFSNTWIANEKHLK